MKIVTTTIAVTTVVVMNLAITTGLSGSVEPFDEIAAAQKYLRGEYNDFEREANHEFRVYGLAYIAEWASLTPVDPGIVSQYLPDVHFYRTLVHTGNYEYMTVETLVAARPTFAGFDIRVCLSPTYAEVSTKFLALFESLQVPEPSKRLGLVRAITQLLAEITYEGRVGDVSGEGRLYRGELWHGKLHWRDIVVQFSESGAVNTVAVVNARR